MLNGLHLHGAWEKCKALHKALYNVLNSPTHRLTHTIGGWAELRNMCPDDREVVQVLYWVIVTVQASEQEARYRSVPLKNKNLIKVQSRGNKQFYLFL